MLTANFYSIYAKAKESQPDCLPQRTPCQDRKYSSSSCFPKVTVRAVSFTTTFWILASRAADYNQQHLNVQLPKVKSGAEQRIGSSVSVVVSLHARCHNQPLSRLELQSGVAGSVLINSPDILPLHFLTVLLKIKFNKNTSPTANIHSSPELHTTRAEFRVLPHPTPPFSLLTEDPN